MGLGGTALPAVKASREKRMKSPVPGTCILQRGGTFGEFLHRLVTHLQRHWTGSEGGSGSSQQWKSGDVELTL